VESLLGIKCVAILTLSDLIAAFEEPSQDASAPARHTDCAPTIEQLAAMRTYRLEYGVKAN